MQSSSSSRPLQSVRARLRHPHRRAPSRLALANARRFASSTGCPACSEERATEDRWFRSYESEKFSDAFTISGLAAALGPCPAHTARWLGSSLSNELAVTAYSAIVSRARAKLASDERARAACPICAAAGKAGDDVVRTLLLGLGEPSVCDTIAVGSGLCPRHGLSALAQGSIHVVVLLARLRARLERADPAELVELLTTGIGRSRPPVPEMSDDEDEFMRSSARIVDALALGTCLACRATAEAEERAVRGEAAASLCGEHLGWLSELDAGGASRLATVKREAWLELLGVIVAELRSPRGGTGSASHRVRLRAILAGSPLSLPCPACTAGREAGAREYDALRSAITEPRVADAVADTHGLCLGHVLDPPGDACPQLIRDALDTRLAIVGWELGEAWRLGDWSQRFDEPGTEVGATVRAAQLIDGRFTLQRRATAASRPDREVG